MKASQSRHAIHTNALGIVLLTTLPARITEHSLIKTSGWVGRDQHRDVVIAMCGEYTGGSSCMCEHGLVLSTTPSTSFPKDAPQIQFLLVVSRHFLCK